jgi:AcrR family transcriptional regulator
MATEAAKTKAGPERKLRADAERNRQRILAAGALEFAERGLAVTMDDVAARARVGVGTVYRRFPEKSDLIAALFEERIERLIGYAEAGLEYEDPWEGIVSFLEHACEMHAEDRSLRELIFGSGQGRAFYEAANARIRPLADQLAARAKASGQLRPDVEAFDMPMIQMMVAGVMDYLGAAAPDVWRRALTIAVDGLRTSRDEPTPLPAAALRERQMQRAIPDG